MLTFILRYFVKLNAIILIIAVVHAVSLISVHEDEGINLQIYQQLRRLERCFEDDADVIILLHGTYYSHYTLQFLKELVAKRPIIIMEKRYIYGLSRFQLSRMEYILIFVQNAKHLVTAINENTRNSWAAAKYIMVINKPVAVDEHIRLDNIIKNVIWKARIINFVIVFYEYNLNMLSYNPFSKEVMNFSDLNTCNIFPDKTKNLHTYELKVSIFSDPPVVEYPKNGEPIGPDVTLLELISNKMNFRVKFVIPPGISSFSPFTDAHVEVIGGRTDFCFVTHFVVSHTYNAQYTYPDRMNNVVVMMMKQDKSNKKFNFYRSFDGYSWVGITVSILAIAIMQYLIASVLNTVRSTLHDTLLYTWTVLHNTPLSLTIQRTMPVKSLLLIWIMCAMLINFAFLCFTTSIVIHPPRAKYIDTLQELGSNHVRIKVRPVIKNRLSDQKFLNLIEVGNNFRYERFRGVDNDSAVAVNEAISDILVKQHPQLRVVKEYLLPAHSGYYFPLNSPYIVRINQIIRMNNEFGITKYKENLKRFATNQLINKNEKHYASLQILQVVQAFHLLIIGYIICILVFSCELLFFNLFQK